MQEHKAQQNYQIKPRLDQLTFCWSENPGGLMMTVLSTKFVAQFEIRKYNASGFAVLSQVCFGCQQQNYIKLKSFCIAK